MVDWYNFSREVCISILENFGQKTGGPGKIIQINESKFGTGLCSKHVPIVPVLVESWSGQVNSGPW